MGAIKSLIMLIFLIIVINVLLNKNGKYLKKDIQWQHYLFGCFFILYLMIALEEVGFPTLFEWRILLKSNEPIFNPHINLIPFNNGLEITDVLNILLFMPFGFLLPTLWEKYRNLKSTLYYGLFFSFTIEVSQLFVRNRETDINDLIMNVVGTICGWIIFNIMRKVFYKLADKTVIHIDSKDTLFIKLEPYLYIVIAIICTFFIMVE